MDASNLAAHLVPGDLVNLDNDPYFDPECPGLGCPHRTQNAELIEVIAEPHWCRMVFRNNEERFTATVPHDHVFAEAD